MEPQREKTRLRTLVFLSWPAIVEQVMTTLVSYVDTAMVGVLGAAATAAVSVNAACIWLMNGVLGGVGVGYSVQVANAVGAGDWARVRKTSRQGLLGGLAAGMVFLFAFQLLAGVLPKLLGAEPEVLPQAVEYLRWYTLSAPFVALLSVYAAVLRCMGDTRSPMAINTLTNLINIVLNFFLIFPTRTMLLFGAEILIPGMGMGVAGAAVASAIANGAGGILMAWMALKRQGEQVGLREWATPDREISLQAVKLGLPYALERASINLGQITTTGIVAHLGTVALAANHIAITAEGLCYLPAYGISFAATALVGQAVGAGSRENARAYGKLSGWLGFGLCVLTGLALFLFAAPLSALFNREPEVIGLSADCLRIAAFCEPLFAVSIVLSGALRGARDVGFPMWMCMICMWGIRIELAALFVYVFDWGLRGVWLAFALELSIRGLSCVWRWASHRWEKKCGFEK